VRKTIPEYKYYNNKLTHSSVLSNKSHDNLVMAAVILSLAAMAALLSERYTCRIYKTSMNSYAITSEYIQIF